MNVNELLQALQNQENFKQTKTIKDLVQKNDQQAIKVCTQAIQTILQANNEPMQVLMSLRLAKEIIEMNSQDVINTFALTVLPQMEIIAQFRKDDTSETRGKYMYNKEPTKTQAQVGNSIFRLVLDSIQVWSHWYPVDPVTQNSSVYKHCYDRLLRSKVSFPKLSYYKTEDLVKKQASLSETSSPQKSQIKSPTKQVVESLKQPQQLQKTSTIQVVQASPQKKSQKETNDQVRDRANRFLEALQGEQELIGDILTSDEGADELDMLDECCENMRKFKDQAENLLLDLIDLEFDGKEKIMEDLLLKQDFLDTFADDFHKWKTHRNLTFSSFKKKYMNLNTTSTPNPDMQTPNPDMIVNSKQIQSHIQQEKVISQQQGQNPNKSISYTDQVKQNNTSQVDKQDQQHQFKQQSTLHPTNQQNQNQSNYNSNSKQSHSSQEKEQFQQQGLDQSRPSIQISHSDSMGRNNQSFEDKQNLEYQTKKEKPFSVNQSNNPQSNNPQSNFSSNSSQPLSLQFNKNQPMTQPKIQTKQFQPNQSSISKLSPEENVQQSSTDAQQRLNQGQKKIIENQWHDQTMEIEGSVKKMQALQGPASIARQPTTFIVDQLINNHENQRYNVDSNEDEQDKMNPNQSSIQRHSATANSSLNYQLQISELLIVQQSQEITDLKEQNQTLIAQLSSKQNLFKTSSINEDKITRDENNILRTEAKIKDESNTHQLITLKERIKLLIEEKKQLVTELLDYEQVVNRQKQDNVDTDHILQLTKENSHLLQDNKKWQMQCTQNLEQIELLKNKLKSIDNQQNDVPQLTPVVKFSAKDINQSSARNQIFNNKLQNYHIQKPHSIEDNRSRNNFNRMQENRSILRSESIQGSRIVQNESFMHQQLHPTFDSKIYSNKRAQTRSSSQEQQHNRLPNNNRSLSVKYKELIYPYLNPLDYYVNRIQKPQKGRHFITKSLNTLIIDQTNLDNLKLTMLKKKHTLYISKYLTVGAEAKIMDSKMSINLGLYFINQNKEQGFDCQVSYQFSQTGLKIEPFNVDEHFQLLPGNQRKHEFMVALLDPPFRLQTAQVNIELDNSRKVIYEFHLPISLFNFVECQQIKFQAYKKIWRSNIPNCYKTDSFRINPNILLDGDNITALIPDMILLNSHKRDDYLAGIDEIKYGGIWQCHASKFIVRFVIKPSQEMFIQMAQFEGQRDARILEQLINTVTFLFSL